MATQVFQITISTHPSLSGAFTWSCFISNTFVVGRVEKTRDENDTWHSYWNEKDTWLLKSSDSICGTPEGYPAVKILTRIPGWIPKLEKNVSRQKACSIPLKIWYFQSKSSRWQGQWCLYWSPKLFLHPSNLCFPPTIWPWSSAMGVFKNHLRANRLKILYVKYIDLNTYPYLFHRMTTFPDVI